MILHDFDEDYFLEKESIHEINIICSKYNLAEDLLHGGEEYLTEWYLVLGCPPLHHHPHHHSARLLAGDDHAWDSCLEPSPAPRYCPGLEHGDSQSSVCQANSRSDVRQPFLCIFLC